MGKQSKTSVHPVKIHLPSPELQTTILRGVGFRAGSSGGWKGPTRRTYREARKDAHEHKNEPNA